MSEFVDALDAPRQDCKGKDQGVKDPESHGPHHWYEDGRKFEGTVGEDVRLCMGRGDKAWDKQNAESQ